MLSMIDSEIFRWVMSVMAVAESTAFLVLSLQKHIHNQSTQLCAPPFTLSLLVCASHVS